MKQPVRIGVFATQSRANGAMDALIDAGLPKDRISVICPEGILLEDDTIHEEDPAGSHTAGYAAAGGAVGAVLAGIGAAAGFVATGGVGLVAAGPLLAGVAAGAVGGGFVGAMMSRGIEPEIADYYDQALGDGKILIAYEDDDEKRLKQVERLFSRSGAEPIRLTAG